MKEVKNAWVQAQNGALTQAQNGAELMPGRPTWTPTQDPTPRPEHYQSPKRRRARPRYNMSNYPL